MDKEISPKAAQTNLLVGHSLPYTCLFSTEITLLILCAGALTENIKNKSIILYSTASSMAGMHNIWGRTRDVCVHPDLRDLCVHSDFRDVCPP